MPGRDEARIVRAAAQRRRRRLERVAGESVELVVLLARRDDGRGMGVVVDRPNGVDRREEARVGALGRCRGEQRGGGGEPEDEKNFHMSFRGEAHGKTAMGLANVNVNAASGRRQLCASSPGSGTRRCSVPIGSARALGSALSVGVCFSRSWRARSSCESKCAPQTTQSYSWVCSMSGLLVELLIRHGACRVAEFAASAYRSGP